MSEVIFDAEKHTYTLDGIEYPSVTQILADCGIIKTRFYTEDGKSRGKEIHALTALLDKGLITFDSIKDHEYAPYVSAWIDFCKDFGVKFLEIEKPIVNTLYGYSGTPDRLAVINDCNEIPDIKTGAPEDWHALQLFGYKSLYQESDNFKVSGIYLKPDGKYKRIPYEIDSRIKNTWWGALNVYKWKHK
jgi:hypothetical protein